MNVYLPVSRVCIQRYLNIRCQRAHAGVYAEGVGKRGKVEKDR